jgi:hypothetical protein
VVFNSDVTVENQLFANLVGNVTGNVIGDIRGNVASSERSARISSSHLTRS